MWSPGWRPRMPDNSGVSGMCRGTLLDKISRVEDLVRERVGEKQ